MDDKIRRMKLVKNATPFGRFEFLANAKCRQKIVAMPPDRFGRSPGEEIGEMAREKTSRRAVNGRHEFLRRDGAVVWGVEAIVFAAGACLEWLRAALVLIEDPAESEALATSVNSCDGVSFVPALSGLGTPQWDFGARGGFFGITRGTSKAHLVRAVLEGIAQRGADLVDAAQRELGVTLKELRVDGGMTANRFFVQCVANFTGLQVTVSSEREATTRGAGLMALVSAGFLTLDEVEGLWSPADVFLPQFTSLERSALRATWAETLKRVEKTIPELSAIAF